MLDQIQIQALIQSIKMVQLRRLPLGKVQPLQVEEVGGVLVAQPWELMNGVGREKTITLVWYFALEMYG